MSSCFQNRRGAQTQAQSLHVVVRIEASAPPPLQPEAYHRANMRKDTLIARRPFTVHDMHLRCHLRKG